jgi:hypothetical protein
VGRKKGKGVSSKMQALRDRNLSIFGGDSGRVLPPSSPRAERRIARTRVKDKDLQERAVPLRVKRRDGMLRGGLPQ